MSTESDLRAALADEAGRYEPPAGLWAAIAEDIDRRAEGGGRRAAWIAIAVGSILLAGVLIAMASDDGDQRTAPTTLAPGAGAPTTTAPESDPAPATLVAARRDGDIVVLDTTTHDPILTLYRQQSCPTCSPPRSLRLAPGGATLYFEVTDGGRHRILRVAVAGGSPTDVVDGCSPAPSADGRRLAYRACDRDGGDALVVRDLTAGTERRLSIGPGSDDPRPVDAAWSADGSALIFSTAATTGSSLFRLDLATARSTADARRLGPPAAAGEGAAWHHPTSHALGIAVVEACCVVAGAPFSGDADVVVIDAADGRELQRLDGDGSLASSAFDTSGDHALLVSDDGDLFRRSGDRPPVRIGGGFAEAVWS